MKRLLAVALLSLLIAVVALQQLWSWWHNPVPGVDSTLTVSDGSSLSFVAADLAKTGLIKWPRLWVLAARVQSLDAQIKKGEYSLAGPQTPAGLLQRLVDGDVITYSVTVPEGLTFTEALGLIHNQDVLRSVVTGAADPRLLEVIKPFTHPEGLFFPDTYVFQRGDTDLKLLRQAHRRMRAELESIWAARDLSLPYDSPYEALIMASIVEKETGVAAERQQIAGVFIRRLRQGMRLQTDPTVIYGLGDEYRGNLKRRHLGDANNMFNTYRHKGLPPTPIALPGRAALQAAVHPDDGQALYFVAKGDGSHQFSSTLEAHEAAVRRYQLTRRKDYRSAPGSTDQ